MTWWEAVAVVAAGMAGGGVNAVIGSGSLITFPTLLAVGYGPKIANISNNIGMVPGAVSGAYGFRRELQGQRSRVRTLAVASGSGGLTGGLLLLALPSSVFDAVVPILVLVACALMAAQPPLSRWVAARRPEDARDVGFAPLAIAYGAGIYGGYFGAAQGVILLAMLAVFVPDDLKRSNALKNVLAGTVNGVAAVLFIVCDASKLSVGGERLAHVSWLAVLLVGIGALTGGAIGARIGRRIPPTVLRGLVVVIGVGVALKLLLT